MQVAYKLADRPKAIQIVSYHTGIELEKTQRWQYVDLIVACKRCYCVLEHPRSGYRVAYLKDAKGSDN
jgi:hypothetical protein